jgi:hypothetical protein
MTLTTVIEIAAAILVSLGGAGAIVISAASWLGKVWANRILESDRRRYGEELERLRSELETSRRMLQAELDKALHVHRVQFETEFRVLAEIWAKLAALRSAMGALRPMADIVDRDEDPDARLKRRLGTFDAALHDFMRAVDDKSPFYPEAILRELSEALTIANRESISVSLGKPDQSTDWFKEGQANFRAFKDAAETVSSLIRQRLESLRLQR